MENTERNDDVRCKNCQRFSGINPLAGEGPEAWCAPSGTEMARPCNPFDKAGNYPCFEKAKETS